MAKIPNYNMDDLPDSPNIPAGRYRAELIKVIAGKTKDKKFDMLTWQWRIKSGPLAAEKATINSYTTFSGYRIAEHQFKMHMMALGRKKSTGGNSDDLLHRIVTLVVAEGSYNDKITGELRTSARIVELLPKDASLKVKKVHEDIEDEEAEEPDEGDEEEEEEEEEEESEEEEEAEEEEEEEEEPPTKKKKSKAGKPKKKHRKETEDEDLPF